jgi:hypothetical protein
MTTQQAKKEQEQLEERGLLENREQLTFSKEEMEVSKAPQVKKDPLGDLIQPSQIVRDTFV